MWTRAMLPALVAGLVFGTVACTAHTGSAPTTSPAAARSAGVPTTTTGPRTSTTVSGPVAQTASTSSTATPPTSPTKPATTGTTSLPARAPVTAPGSPAPTTLTTESAIWTTASTDWAGPIHPCGWAVTPGYPTGPTALPAPNACNDIAPMTPGCHVPTLIVSDGVTQTLSTWNPPTGGPDSSLIYAGGDGYICINEDGDRTIEMSHGDGGLVVQPNDNPIVYAARIGLQRSSGVWGIARRDVTHVEIVDAAHPNGVFANLTLGTGWDTKIFIAPVSSSRVLITAFDAAGRQLDQTTVPPCC